MSTTHDITIASDAVGVGSTLSRISICPAEHPGRPTGNQSTSLRQPMLRYELLQPHRDSTVCNETRHYICTLTKLHGPDGLFVMVHDRTWISQDVHDNNSKDKDANPDTSFQQHSTSTTLPAHSQSSDHSPTAAPLGSDRTTSTTTTCLECKHRTHNVKGVLDWHRFRVEMLRHVVEERYQRLLLEQGLDPFDLKNDSSGPTITRLAQASPHDKVVQHHYTQQTFNRSILPILYPNKGCEDGYWDVLSRIDWGSMLVSTRTTTTVEERFAVSAEGTDLTSALRTDAQDTYHHGVTEGGDSTGLGDNGFSVDTVPSSSGLRVKPLQPNHTNLGVKFPTVYEIDTSGEGGEGGMRLLNGGRGFPLVQHPSGQVKVLWGASIYELYRDRDWESCLVRSSNDSGHEDDKEWEVVDLTEEIEVTEEKLAMVPLGDSSSRKRGRVMDTRRNGGIFSGEMKGLMPIESEDGDLVPSTTRVHHRTRHTAPVAMSGATNPGLEAIVSESGCDTTLQIHPPTHLPLSTITTTTTTKPMSTLPAPLRIQSLKAQRPYPSITYNKSPTSTSRSLRTTRHIVPPSPDNHHLQPIATVFQQQNRDGKVVDGQDARCVLDEGRERVGRRGGGYLGRNGSRESAASYEEKEVQDQEQICFTQRRNGKQFFENPGSGCFRTSNTLTLSDHHYQQQPMHHRTNTPAATTRQRTMSASASDKWKPSLATIPSQEALELVEVEPTRENSFYVDMMTTTTTAEEYNIYNGNSPLLAAGVNTQVHSQPPTTAPAVKAVAATIPIPKRTSSTASITSITSNKSSSSKKARSSTTGPTFLKLYSSLSATSTPLRHSLGSAAGTKGDKVPSRRSSDNPTLPSIASILKQSLYNSNNNNNNNNNNNYSNSRPSMSLPSLIHDPRVPHERSRLVEKGVKFAPDDAPQSVRVGRTIELIRLARQPLEVLPTSSTATTPTTTARTAGKEIAGDGPISPTSDMFWKTPLALARRRRSSTVSSSIEDPALSPKLDRPLPPVPPVTPTTAEPGHHSRRDRNRSDSSIDSNIRTDSKDNNDYNDYNDYNNITSPIHDSDNDIIIFPTGTTKTARDLTLSPPQSTRIALMCTVCHQDLQVTDQKSLMAFAGHIMECDSHDDSNCNNISSDSSSRGRRKRRSSGRMGSKSLSSSMFVPTATFQKMRTKIEDRLLVSRKERPASCGDCA